MLWLKAFHLIFMVTWFAGLFYLPRLFVYHAMASDKTSLDRFKIMERKLYYGIMAPGAIFTLLFGLGLLYFYHPHEAWLYLKLALVVGLIIYHLYCGKLRQDFAHDRNTHSHRYYRFLNEVPVLFLVLIIILVVVKP
ncbi:MAG: protoporphyrinogen oxidase HemJ [Gammaproteobacteria bacterium]|nr:protoporphyrinogen oxidase HemJ [Gammaproteobacteria bacterium]